MRNSDFLVFTLLSLSVISCKESDEEPTEDNSMQEVLTANVWEPMDTFSSGQEGCDGETQSISFYPDGTHRIEHPNGIITGTYKIIINKDVYPNMTYIYMDNNYKLTDEEEEINFQSVWHVTGNYEVVIHIYVESNTKTSPIDCHGFVLRRKN